MTTHGWLQQRRLYDFERMLLRGRPSYLAGEEISVADILAVCELEQPGMEGFRVGEGRPIIAKYMDSRVSRDLVSLAFNFSIKYYVNDNNHKDEKGCVMGSPYSLEAGAWLWRLEMDAVYL